MGALKEFLDKVGGPLQRPTDHAGANGQEDPPPPPRDRVLAYQVLEVLCKSHTAYMTRYTATARQEPQLFGKAGVYGGRGGTTVDGVTAWRAGRSLRD